MTRLLLPPSLLTLIFTTLTSLPLSSAATDYTISSFDNNQRPQSLSPACNTIYSTAIPLCQPYDFTPVNPCSAACISSLQSLQTQAQAACSGQTIPQQSMLRFFRDGQGVTELCTTQKQVSGGGGPTTFATSTIPVATTAPSTTSASAAAQSSGFEQQQTSGMLALSKPALLAVVISIVIAFAIFFIIAVTMYRKHYRK
jgi:hypothetical protein